VCGGSIEDLWYLIQTECFLKIFFRKKEGFSNWVISLNLPPPPPPVGDLPFLLIPEDWLK